jgi:hypothetical protein
MEQRQQIRQMLIYYCKNTSCCIAAFPDLLLTHCTLYIDIIIPNCIVFIIEIEIRFVERIWKRK